MQIPWWKKCLSYLFEIHMESTSSTYNEALHVSLVQGRMQLTTPTAIYSWADKYDNFKIAFEEMNLDQLAIKDVLILGFGLGSIPFMLEHVFGQKYVYTGVEIDEEVIYLASKYMLPNLESPVNMIQADASSFVHIDPSKYDLITMDVFIGHKIPTSFLNKAFVKDLSESLSDKGIVMFNMLAQRPSDRKEVKAFYEDHFIKVFPNGICKPIKGNMMLISDQYE